MSYGPGDNAFVIDRPSSEGGDKIQVFATKTKAQLDRLYEQLNSDVHEASENEKGFVQLAKLTEVNMGISDDTAITPYTFDKSALASTARNASKKAADNAAAITGIRADISTVEDNVSAAQDTADSALAKAQAVEDRLPAGSGALVIPNMPTADTFKVMPSIVSHSASHHAITLPSGGTYAYCGAVHYTLRQSGGQSGDVDTDYDQAITGVAAGGTEIFNVSDSTFLTGFVSGFIWKIS